MSQLTTHVLDTSRGRPAAGVPVTLFQHSQDQWKSIARGITNADGRIPDLLPVDRLLEQGVYKLRFDTAVYFQKLSVDSFYPFVEVSFSISSGEHYHVPLLLNPFGYSTYRGS